MPGASAERINVDRISRWPKLATTWFRKSARTLLVNRERARNAEEVWLIGYEAEHLIENVLVDAETLVDLLDQEQAELCEAVAKNLAKALRARRLSFALDNVTGRTPEEAASFRAKAASLR